MVPALTFVKMFLVGLLLNTIDTQRVLHISVAVSWFLRAPTQMLGPSPQAIASKRVLGIKEFRPSARFKQDHSHKPGGTLC